MPRTPIWAIAIICAAIGAGCRGKADVNDYGAEQVETARPLDPATAFTRSERQLLLRLERAPAGGPQPMWAFYLAAIRQAGAAEDRLFLAEFNDRELREIAAAAVENDEAPVPTLPTSQPRPADREADTFRRARRHLAEAKLDRSDLDHAWASTMQNHYQVRLELTEALLDQFDFGAPRRFAAAEAAFDRLQLTRLEVWMTRHSPAPRLHDHLKSASGFGSGIT